MWRNWEIAGVPIWTERAVFGISSDHEAIHVESGMRNITAMTDRRHCRSDRRVACETSLKRSRIWYASATELCHGGVSCASLTVPLGRCAFSLRERENAGRSYPMIATKCTWHAFYSSTTRGTGGNLSSLERIWARNAVERLSRNF